MTGKNKVATASIEGNDAGSINHKSDGSAVPISEHRMSGFVERITCHGLQDWYRAENKLSFSFWGVAFLIALSLLIFSSYSCCYEFYVNPIQTTISVIPMSRLPFPDIYICPTNFLNDTALHLQPSVKKMTRIFEIKGSDTLLSLTSLISDRISNDVSSESHTDNEELSQLGLIQQQEAVINVSLSPERFVAECQFGGDIFDCMDFLERKLDRDFGVCYLMKMSSSNKQQRMNNKGLKLVIDLNTEFTKNQTSLSDGIAVSIHTQFHPISYERILVEAGRMTLITLDAVREKLVTVSRFSKTPQLCIKNGDFEFKILNQKVGYNRPACQFDCVQAVVLESNKCLLPIDAAYVRERHTNNSWCHDTHILNGIDSDDYADCEKECHRPCETDRNSITATSHRIPSSRYRDARESRDVDRNSTENPGLSEYMTINNDHRNMARWENNLVVLDISYSRLEITVMTQSHSMTPITLLSNLGGTFGLWLGASLLTIIQCFAYCFEMGYARYTDSRKG